MNNEKINSKMKLLNNSPFVILIFVILKFRNIGRYTFRRSKFWLTPLKSLYYRYIFFHFFSPLYMRHSRPFRPGCDLHYFFFFFIQVCYGWPQKNYLQQLSDFFENFTGSNGRNRREIRAVIDSFEIYTINSLMKKKIFETNFIISRALFWVAQSKWRKLKWFFSRLRCNGKIPCPLILFQSFFPTYSSKCFSKILLPYWENYVFMEKNSWY